jgi:hypothetical protein
MSTFYVTGPGHGGPVIVGSVYIEGFRSWRTALGEHCARHKLRGELVYRRIPGWPAFY